MIEYHVADGLSFHAIGLAFGVTPETVEVYYREYHQGQIKGAGAIIRLPSKLNNSNKEKKI